MGDRIIVIGASLSGIDALRELMGYLPADFPAPILITQHVAPHSPGLLPQILTAAGKLEVAFPKNPEPIKKGRVYIAPPDRHMLVEKDYVRLSHGPHENCARPAIDPLFRSAALAYGPAVVGVVLTGQLDDGTAGLLAVKDQGGTTIVQEPMEATARSMPVSALRHVSIDHRCTLAEMGPLLTRLAEDDPEQVAAEPRALMAVEIRMAQGIINIDDWWLFEQMSKPSGLNCPECRSALYEVQEARLVRFRCRSGHGYSALSLLSGQSDAREAMTSSIFGALIEEMTLAKRLRDNPAYSGESYIEGGLAARIEVLEKEGAQVAGWLQALTGLVEIEFHEPLI